VPVRSVLAFWAVAAVLIVAPGPDWAFAIGAGLRRQVVAAAGGLVAGYVAMTAVVAAGVGALIAATPAALTALSVVGGSYLVWLGTKTMRHPATLGGRVDEPTGTAPRHAAARDGGQRPEPQGPADLRRASASVRASPCTMAGAGPARGPRPRVHPHLRRVYLAVGAAARGLLLARPTAAYVVSRISGASMIILGLALLAERLTT
jgi:threonine/homoserine/homoserine lactone efflux protein